MIRRLFSVRYLTLICIALLIGMGAFYQITNSLNTKKVHAATTSHYLYVVEDGLVSVYDIDNNHALVKSFTIPEQGKRGVMISPSRGWLYVSYCGATDCGGGHGSLLAYDLINNKVVFNVTYNFGVDQPAITPDGSKIYMPHGDDATDGITSILDASNGNVIGSISTGTNGHNVVASLDGTQVYITGWTGATDNYIHVVNTATNQYTDVGPVINGVRPFTVNGNHTLIYTTSSNTCGFQVLSLVTGKPLYTVPFSGSCTWTASTAPSHGISLSPDEKRIYAIDAPLDQLEVYDVSGVPATAPKFVATVQLNSLSGFSSPCQTNCEREGWVLNDLSGRYVYVGDTGDVISTATLKSVQTIPTLQNTRMQIEADWTNGVITATSTRFGLGRVTSSSPTPTVAPTPPTTTPGPVSKIWYFAEGRVGKGFREYLTVANPSSTTCAVNAQYNYTPEGGAPATKTVSFSVNAYSRFTEAVDPDLGYTENSSTFATVASIVTVNSTSTPNCNGMIAERPIYFTNYNGISSGTDALGVTHLSTNFYFADVPSSSNTVSYLTILNPNSSSANITVNYEAGGSVVGSQTVTVAANSRGTIAPGAITLPTHVAASLTSSQPILVERPTYITNAPVNGSFDVVGASALASDWLFAEGYTTSTSQENLTISNIDPANVPAQVNITLKSQAGATKTFTITVAAKSQTIWNVNANNSFTGSTPEVSAEIVSTGANIVAQREMYFTYHHTLLNGRAMTAVGATDVIGQVGPASHNIYSFAEGYANTGYNDWLTLQNPTGSAESIYVTLVNEAGQSYVQTISIPANGRATDDLASEVQSVFNAGTNIQSNEFSVTVQSSNGADFVVERPIYFNTTGSSFPVQGGDDIIGYTGG